MGAGGDVRRCEVSGAGLFPPKQCANAAECRADLAACLALATGAANRQDYREVLRLLEAAHQVSAWLFFNQDKGGL